MTEERYQEIRKLIAYGISAKKACTTESERVIYNQMKRRRGESSPKPVGSVQTIRPLVAPPSVASILREAEKAANEPISPEVLSLSRYPAQKMDDDFDDLPTDPREILAMIKKAIVRQMKAKSPDSSWAKLGLSICEHELPEWNSKATKLAKDEYQDILGSVFKSSNGFKILERKGNDNNDKPGNVGTAGQPG